jgi:hypothetical protein
VKDFTIQSYKKLLITFKKAGYRFISMDDYVNVNQPGKFIILKHEIDRKPKNALPLAQLEHELGIKSHYYFRIINSCFKPKIITQIIDLGHMIGYHYEDLAMQHGDFSKAFSSFKKNLEKCRQYYPISTASGHGSPFSKWDNKRLWEKFSYKDLGIKSEPYIDIDYNAVYYICDASRSWNNSNVSIRDKVKSNLRYNVNSTDDIIQGVNANQLPHHILLSVHPHNWTSRYIEWFRIYLWQGFKNIFKRIIIKYGFTN